MHICQQILTILNFQSAVMCRYIHKKKEKKVYCTLIYCVGTQHWNNKLPVGFNSWEHRYI